MPGISKAEVLKVLKLERRLCVSSGLEGGKGFKSSAWVEPLPSGIKWGLGHQKLVFGIHISAAEKPQTTKRYRTVQAPVSQRDGSAAAAGNKAGLR